MEDNKTYAEKEQRIQSFMKSRLNKVFGDDLLLTFSKKELAKLCLKEIDYAFEIVDSTDMTDSEYQDLMRDNEEQNNGEIKDA